MYKRALLGLGFGVFVSQAIPAQAGDSASKSSIDRPAHTHRGQTETLRRRDSWVSTMRTDDLTDTLKSANSHSEDKKVHDPKVVSQGSDTGLSKYPIRIAVFGGSKGGSFSQERDLRLLGREVAKAKLPLITGGGNGMPHMAQKAAFEEGGYTVGFGQADSLSDHRTSGRPSDHLSVLYTTATGRGPGTIEREAPLAEQANVGVFAGGSIGTLGELMASLFKPGVLAFLKGSGGVADAATTKILPHLGPLPAHVRIVEESDPTKLLIAAMVELDKVKGNTAFPTRLVKVGHREVFKDPIELKKRANIVSYLVDGQGMSATDKSNLMRLTSRLSTEHIDGKFPVTVVPERAGITQEVAALSVREGAQAFHISHLGPRTVDKLAEGHVRVSMGKGEGVGESATGREVTQDARVVVVAGGDYKTLSGLIYALHHDTIVAVLETGGMSGKLRSDIMPVIVDKGTKARIIYGTDPDRLFESIKRELEPKPVPKYEPKPEKKSYSSERDSDSDHKSWE